MAITFDHQRWIATMRQALSQDEKAYFKALGTRITERRNELGLTQVQMAEALGVAQQTYACYEVGNRRIQVSLLPVLAQALMVDTDVLLGETAKARGKRGPAPMFQRHIEQISRLPKAKQRFVIQVLESMLAQQGG